MPFAFHNNKRIIKLNNIQCKIKAQIAIKLYFIIHYKGAYNTIIINNKIFIIFQQDNLFILNLIVGIVK